MRQWGGTLSAGYQRRTALPQVNPEPKAVRVTICPGSSLLLRATYARSMGSDAAEQFPKRSMLLKVRSAPSSSFWATNSLIRKFAW